MTLTLPGKCCDLFFFLVKDEIPFVDISGTPACLRQSGVMHFDTHPFPPIPQAMVLKYKSLDIWPEIET